MKKLLCLAALLIASCGGTDAPDEQAIDESALRPQHSSSCPGGGDGLPAPEQVNLIITNVLHYPAIPTTHDSSYVVFDACNTADGTAASFAIELQLDNYE